MCISETTGFLLFTEYKAIWRHGKICSNFHYLILHDKLVNCSIIIYSKIIDQTPNLITYILSVKMLYSTKNDSTIAFHTVSTRKVGSPPRLTSAALCTFGIQPRHNPRTPRSAKICRTIWRVVFTLHEDTRLALVHLVHMLSTLAVSIGIGPLVQSTCWVLVHTSSIGPTIQYVCIDWSTWLVLVHWSTCPILVFWSAPQYWASTFHWSTAQHV